MVLFGDCGESADSISVQTKQRTPPEGDMSDSSRHRLDPERRNNNGNDANGDGIDDDEAEDDDEEEEDVDDEEEDDDDDDDSREGADDNDHQTDMLAHLGGDQTTGMNETTNLQDCIDALDSVIEQVPSYLDHIYTDYIVGGSIHDTSLDNTYNHHTTHDGPMVYQHNTNHINHGQSIDPSTTGLPFDHHHTLYNYSALDCFIVHPELIHPQIHDHILHHHTSSISLSYSSLLDNFDVSPNDVERIMESVVAAGDSNNNAITDASHHIDHKQDHLNRYIRRT